jgi:hypothetical protein
MKNNALLLIICGALLLSITSCKDFVGDKYLNIKPKQNLSLNDVFHSVSDSRHFLTSIYAQLPYEIDPADPPSRAPWTGISDEMDITYGGFEGHAIAQGAWDPTNVPDNWDWSYQGIRKTNLFLENIHKLTLSNSFTQADENKWIGETYFLRAYLHFLVFRLYGAIPIMNFAVPSNYDYNKIKRAPVDSVAAFMIQDCDSAAALLPVTRSTNNLGRVNKLAALALKARILLYAASPLFNGDPAFANFTNKDGEHLFPQSYDKIKWKKAALAAKKVIDMAEAAGHKLYVSPSGDPEKSYQELFIKNWNTEVLWATNRSFYHHLEMTQSPLGYGGYSIMSVSQEMVDAYQMADGSTPITGYKKDGSPIINKSSGYKETGNTDTAGKYWDAGVRNMYVNREPRFYASVHFSGQEWKGRQIQMYYSGLDGHSKNASDYSVSGYVEKKFAHPDVNIPQGTGWDLRTWILFRLGREYLNYAEALNEWKGPVADVYKYVNAIRERAGLPDLPTGLTKDQMREKIHHERRIELAFEGARYFDVRRWLEGEKYFNGPLYGLNVDKDRPQFWQRTVIAHRVFESKDYLWPVSQQEIDRDKGLVQDPGW